MSESIGMMDKAYFVGKVAILEWMNELLNVCENLFERDTRFEMCLSLS